MATSGVITSAAPQLLERADELTALAALLEQVAASGAGRLCLIGGEAGVGKTALARAFGGESRVTRVLWGACDSLYTARPLGPFADIADSIGGELADLLRGQARPHEVASALLGLLRDTPPVIA